MRTEQEVLDQMKELANELNDIRYVNMPEDISIHLNVDTTRVLFSHPPQFNCEWTVIHTKTGQQKEIQGYVFCHDAALAPWDRFTKKKKEEIIEWVKELEDKKREEVR